MNLRLAGLATLLLLAGCEAPRPTAAPPQPAPGLPSASASAHMAASCAGAAESLTVSDRGIGGTGVGNEAPAVADRGIGGTGVSNEGGLVRGLPGTQSAERGGGGTGIVGVLTGFRSLCVDGVEIALDRPPQLTMDGMGEATETLLAGEVAAIEARGPANDLHAVSIGVRHEVSGPITAMAPAGGAIEVAGQRVLVSPRTRVAATLTVGGWVAVSGLRDPSGAIRASRLDGRAPGEVLVAGVPERVDDGWQIGGLRLRLPPKLVPGADRVVLSGDLSGGVLQVRQVSDEPLLSRRAALQRIFVESYPTLQGGEIRVAEGVEAGIGPGFGAPPPAGEPVVLELVNAPANALLAVGWREVAVAADPGHGRTPPAPAPAAPMQTPTLAPPVAPPIAPAVVTVAPATTTVTAATVTIGPVAAVTTPVATTTNTTTTTTTVAAASTTVSSVSSDAPSEAATSAAATGGAAPVGTGTTAKGTAPGNGPGRSPSPPSGRSPPSLVGEGQSGGAAPPAPTRGAGADGGGDGPAAPGHSAPGGAGSPGGGPANGPPGGGGGGTANGTAGGSGTGGTGTGGTGSGGTGSSGTGSSGTGTGSGSGTGSVGVSGPPAPPVAGVGGAQQGGRMGDAHEPGGRGGWSGAAGAEGGRDGKHGSGGRHGSGPASAPSAPAHGANNG